MSLCTDHGSPLLVICPGCGYEPPWADEAAEDVETALGRKTAEGG